MSTNPVVGGVFIDWTPSDEWLLGSCDNDITVMLARLFTQVNDPDLPSAAPFVGRLADALETAYPDTSMAVPDLLSAQMGLDSVPILPFGIAAPAPRTQAASAAMASGIPPAFLSLVPASSNLSVPAEMPTTWPLVERSSLVGSRPLPDAQRQTRPSHSASPIPVMSWTPLPPPLPPLRAHGRSQSDGAVARVRGADRHHPLLCPVAECGWRTDRSSNLDDHKFSHLKPEYKLMFSASCGYCFDYASGRRNDVLRHMLSCPCASKDAIPANRAPMVVPPQHPVSEILSHHMAPRAASATTRRRRTRSQSVHAAPYDSSARRRGA